MMIMTDRKTFEDIEAWKAGLELACECFTVAKELRRSRHYSLANQLERSAASVPTNIAEGYGRFGVSDEIKFLIYARASNNETLSHLVLAEKTGCVSKARAMTLRRQYERVGSLLGGYIKYLRTTALNKPVTNKPPSFPPINR